MISNTNTKKTIEVSIVTTIPTYSNPKVRIILTNNQIVSWKIIMYIYIMICNKSNEDDDIKYTTLFKKVCVYIYIDSSMCIYMYMLNV